MPNKISNALSFNFIWLIPSITAMLISAPFATANAVAYTFAQIDVPGAHLTQGTSPRLTGLAMQLSGDSGPRARQQSAA